MISESIIKAIINNSSKENVNNVMLMLINNISGGYSYNDARVNHILELLLENKVVQVKDINIEYIKEHEEFLMYKHEGYNFKDIRVLSVDNIDCSILVEYYYTPKDKVDWNKTTTGISFLDYPDVLKKS